MIILDMFLANTKNEKSKAGIIIILLVSSYQLKLQWKKKNQFLRLQ